MLVALLAEAVVLAIRCEPRFTPKAYLSKADDVLHAVLDRFAAQIAVIHNFSPCSAPNKT